MHPETNADRQLLMSAERVFEQCRTEAVPPSEDFPHREFELIKQQGLLSATLPARYGGREFGLPSCPGKSLALLELLRRMGRGNLSAGRLFDAHVTALELIRNHGTPEQHERYFSEVARRQCMFSDWDSNDPSDRVHLVVHGGKAVLRGTKSPATGAGHADYAVVGTYMLVNGEAAGYQLCVIPTTDVVVDGASWEPLGMRATASRRVTLTGIEVTEEMFLGKPGDYHRQPWLMVGCSRYAAVQLGGGEAYFDAARDYLRKVERTDDPYQRARFAEAAMALETARLWIRSIADATEASAALFSSPSEVRPPPTRDGPLASYVAYQCMTRTVVEEACIRVMRLLEQSLGVRALLRPHPFEQIHRDLTTYLRQPAPDRAMASVGSHVLGSERSSIELWDVPRWNEPRL